MAQKTWTTKGQTIVSGIKNEQKTFAPILSAHTTPSGNIALVFEHSEVIMPGNFRLSFELCVGDEVKAWWSDDGKFHIVRKDS